MPLDFDHRQNILDYNASQFQYKQERKEKCFSCITNKVHSKLDCCQTLCICLDLYITHVHEQSTLFFLCSKSIYVVTTYVFPSNSRIVKRIQFMHTYQTLSCLYLHTWLVLISVYVTSMSGGSIAGASLLRSPTSAYWAVEDGYMLFTHAHNEVKYSFFII